MHMKELQMFTYNSWMGCLQPDTKLIILSSYQHCKHSHMHVTPFSSIKARFSHTSTVTRLHSCSGKKICVLLACILFLYRNQYFLTFLRQNRLQKVLVFHSVRLGACPQPRAYLRGGFRGFKPPPPEIFRFFFEK